MGQPSSHTTVRTVPYTAVSRRNRPIHRCIEKRIQFESVKESLRESLFHVVGSGIPPGAESVDRTLVHIFGIDTIPDEFEPPSFRLLPLSPDDAPEVSPYPAVKLFHDLFARGVLKVVAPATQFRVQRPNGVGELSAASLTEDGFQAFPEFPVTFRGDPQTGILFQCHAVPQKLAFPRAIHFAFRFAHGKFQLFP